MYGTKKWNIWVTWQYSVLNSQSSFNVFSHHFLALICDIYVYMCTIKLIFYSGRNSSGDLKTKGYSTKYDCLLFHLFYFFYHNCYCRYNFYSFSSMFFSLNITLLSLKIPSNKKLCRAWCKIWEIAVRKSLIIIESVIEIILSRTN